MFDSHLFAQQVITPQEGVGCGECRYIDISRPGLLQKEFEQTERVKTAAEIGLCILFCQRSEYIINSYLRHQSVQILQLRLGQQLLQQT